MNKYSLYLLLFLLPCLSLNAQHLRISKNKRYIESSDGKPFLWIGDTAWELFHKLNREEATRYLKKRADQGFTVIQAVVLAEDSGLEKPNAYGHLPLINMDPENPDESYFKHIDFIVNKAADLNLVIAILPTWGDKVPSSRPGKGPVVFNRKNASVFGEFLGKRYKDKPVVWVLGGDRNIDSEEAFQIWKSMAMGLKKGDQGNNLLTYHPAGEESSSKWFQNEHWIDFNMYQSGHAHRFMEVYKFAQQDYHKKPVKPFVEAEPAYEDIPVKFWEYINWNIPEKVPPRTLNKDNLLIDKGYFKEGFFTNYDIRVHAYWNLLSGACGYTYGHNAVWQMFKKGESFVIPCLGDWEEALDRPGAQEMKHVKKLFEQMPFSKLIPDQTLIVGDNPEGSGHVRAALADDAGYAIIYLPDGKPIKISMHKFKHKMQAKWFDPRIGVFSKPIKIKADVQTLLTPPKTEEGTDFILVLELQ